MRLFNIKGRYYITALEKSMEIYLCQICRTNRASMFLNLQTLAVSVLFCSNLCNEVNVKTRECLIVYRPYKNKC